MTQTVVGVEWVLALVNPWAISPHPNFSQGEISASARLALVTERRWERESRRYESLVSTSSEWEVALVDAVERSLVADSQSQAVADLWELAGTSGLSDGARVAAAIYGSVGLAEMDRPVEAAHRLATLETVLRRSSLSTLSMSSLVVLVTLKMQRVLRLSDSQQFDAALDQVKSVLALIDTGSSECELVELSEGISWGVEQVHRDVLDATRQRALRAMTLLDDIDSDSWVDVVRAKRPWLDVRSSYTRADRDSFVLRDYFEARIESTLNVRHYLRTRPIDQGYAALLTSEISGSVDQSELDRESLGKILMVSQQLSEHSAREALRLFRFARAPRLLKSSAQWLRDQGPVSALLAEARTVLERESQESRMTECDLLILGFAADFMTRSERQAAIKLSFEHLATAPRNGTGVRWSAHDRVWRAVRQLMGGANSDAWILERASEYLDDSGSLSRPLTSTLAGVFDQIEWSSTSEEIRTPWTEWARSGQGAEETVELRDTILVHEFGRPTEESSQDLMQSAAVIADGGRATPEQLDEVGQYLVARLEGVADQAQHGMRTVGGYEPGNVAAAFALATNDSEVWDQLVIFLSDPNVDTASKSDALDRLARRFTDIPHEVVLKIRDKATQILHSPRRAMSIDPQVTGEFPPALRLLGVSGALDGRAAMEAIMDLAAGEDRAKREAALSVPAVLSVVPVIWGQGLLLQLSRDSNPRVKSAAAGGLAETLGRESELDEVVRERILSLLESDGLQIPAGTMHGLRRAGEVDAERVAFAEEAVRRIALDSRARVLRVIATEFIDAIWGTN
uniref:hypothetical protein n=1 Tax=Pseudoclavibacter sp. RFBI5 TaxID=2080578 RepID=UPI0011B00D79|nr:hypothetical protein [Pseudoclavibacter sp. RFBI5]